MFVRAAARAHPFAEQSAAIAVFDTIKNAEMRKEFGPAASLFCVANEHWQGGPPQSFVLGPGHRIVFADRSISVTYGDEEQRTHLRLPIGVAFLPIRHTTLAVTTPVVGRRHFFEWFAWTPDTTANPSSWKLDWTLSEVVGTRWIHIIREESLVVVKGPSPPASFDATHLVRLRVNTTGEAEFIIDSASSPRTAVIPWQTSR